MKAVLISIQPKWCELIAIKKKSLEVRKNRPKLETPFRCYIRDSKIFIIPAAPFVIIYQILTILSGFC